MEVAREIMWTLSPSFRRLLALTLAGRHFETEETKKVSSRETMRPDICTTYSSSGSRFHDDDDDENDTAPPRRTPTSLLCAHRRDEQAGEERAFT